MITPHWQHFEHKADMGVRGFGNEPAEAFEQAALVMSAIITDLSLIEPSEEINIICEQEDQGILIRSSSLRGMAEEAPAAYKDVNDVVKTADQAGLSRMIAKLEPLICIKG